MTLQKLPILIALLFTSYNLFAQSDCIDTSFEINGLVLEENDSLRFEVIDFVIDQKKNIYAFGSAADGQGKNVGFIHKYTAKGEKIRGFGNEGLLLIENDAVYSSINDVVIISNDTLVLLMNVLNNSADVAAVKITSDGNIINSFGDSGIFTYSTPVANEVGNQMVLLNDKLFIVGTSDNKGFILSLDQDGVINQEFNNSGVRLDSFGLQTEFLIAEVDYNIHVAGRIYNGTDWDIMIVDYNDRDITYPCDWGHFPIDVLELPGNQILTDQAIHRTCVPFISGYTLGNMLEGFIYKFSEQEAFGDEGYLHLNINAENLIPASLDVNNEEVISVVGSYDTNEESLLIYLDELGELKDSYCSGSVDLLFQNDTRPRKSSYFRDHELYIIAQADSQENYYLTKAIGGSKWFNRNGEYLYQSEGGFGIGSIQKKITELATDTIIKSNYYRILRDSSILTKWGTLEIDTLVEHIYLRESGSTVYYFDRDNRIERVLYDFTLEEGDSVEINGLNNLLVQSTGEFGPSLRSYTIEYTGMWDPGFGFDFRVPLVERYGAIRSGPILWFEAENADTDGLEFHLCRYKNDLGEYQEFNAWYQGCQVFHTSIEENILEDEVKIFPSPSSHIVNIISPKPTKRLCIYDMTGVLVSSADTHLEQVRIDVNPYPPGIYMVVGYDEKNHKVFVERIVKM